LGDGVWAKEKKPARKSLPTPKFGGKRTPIDRTAAGQQQQQQLWPRFALRIGLPAVFN